MSAFNKEDDALLMKLRSNRYYTPFAEIARLMPKHTQDSLRNRMWELRKKDEKWYEKEVLGFLDIESDAGFKANSAMILSWALRVKGKTYSDCITKKEIFEGSFDKRIVASLIEALSTVDVVIGYYSTGFDLPFVRTRAIIHRLPFPVYDTIKHIDVFFHVRNKLSLNRKSLDAACAVYGIEGKTHFDVSVWFKARFGDKQALKFVLAHNRADTEILERLWDKIKAYVKTNRNSI